MWIKIILLWANSVFSCDQLIKEQLDLLRQPRHSVQISIDLTIYDDPMKTSYSGEVLEYKSALQSKLKEESCTPVENNQSVVLNGSTLTFTKGGEIQTFNIHCDGSFIIGVGEFQKVIATFSYQYNIRSSNEISFDAFKP
jgi:hypothetical protein